MTGQPVAGQAAPRIALSPGEPAGVGPEICVKLAQAPPPGVALVAFADRELLRARAAWLGLPLDLVPYRPGEALPAVPGRLAVAHVGLGSPAVPGQPQPDNRPYVLAALRAAANEVRRGHLDALVTGPVHKATLDTRAAPFSGHTEFLAALCGVPQTVMLLVSDGLRVALATTHLPLRQVADAITKSRLAAVIRTLHRGLRDDFGIADPRIAVCGLNPHAGEGGHLGHEEREIIAPTLAGLRAEGMALAGPLPADTLFTPRNLADTDAALAMYHDQGLPVIKHKGFGATANVTLGLPIIRTSVDHGTAFDIAAAGSADAGSLRYALQCACDMHRRRQELAGS